MDATTFIPTDHIQVEVNIRLGKTRLSVGELSRLRPDDVLPLDQAVGEGVEICIGDKVVAHGQLVDDGTPDGPLSVRVIGPVPM